MNPIIEHIITLIKGAKADNRIRYTDPNSGMIYTLGSSRYLLGQTVRQYWIPNDHIFISEAAKETWNRITSQSIRGCSYQATVVFEKDESLTVYEYTGASKTPMVKQLKKGDSFHYRQVFHDEHVVGVEDILDALCELPDDKLNEQNVIGILDHIYICKIPLCFNKRLISVPCSIADAIILNAKTNPSAQTFSAGQGDAFVQPAQ